MRTIRSITLASILFLGLTLILNILAGSPISTVIKDKSGVIWVSEAQAASPKKADPLEAMNIYLDGFHFHNGDMGRQIEAHHFCSVVREGLIQCVVFDGKEADARLMGVEYVISEQIFKNLPEDEKKMWHSHAYEVKSGMLIVPALSEAEEYDLMKNLISTYGKTWHFWQLEQPGMDLPLGPPALMMGFTADGQAKPDLVKERDKQFNISTEEKVKKRADIPTPPPQPGADAWQTGQVFQLELVPKSGKNK